MGLTISSLLAAAMLIGASRSVAQNPTPKQAAPVVFDDGSGAYVTGRYANLFLRDGHSEKATRAKIDAAYQQLFHGDPQTQAVVFPAGKNANGPLEYLTDWAHHDVRTEGMSYGMMIAVQLNKKADFDALWNWAMTYMYLSDPKAPGYEFFRWSCKPDGTPNSQTPAPDGEEFFAMALLFAGNRWPGGHGIYDYHAEAEKLLTAMVHRQVITAMGPRGPYSVGPEMNPDPPLVLFVPAIMPHPFTDASYHLPAFYELFARWGPAEDRAYWERAATESRKFFLETTNPQSGLAPDYANFDGTPAKSWFGNQTSHFGYDAWRVERNWAVDWSWWRKAPAEQVLSDRIQKFFASQGIATYGPIYELDGQPIPVPHRPGVTPETKSPGGLVGTNAVASLAATNTTRARLFPEALWNEPIPSGFSRYYDGMLYLMSLMHVSGEYRIIQPAK